MDRATNGDAESEGVRGVMGELGIPTGLTDAAAQVLETVGNRLQIMQMFQVSVPPRRRRGPSRLLQCPELRVHGTQHPLQPLLPPAAPALQQLCSRRRWAVYETAPALRRRRLWIIHSPCEPARHRLSLLLGPVPGFAVSCLPLHPLADSPAPTWAEPARC